MEERPPAVQPVSLHKPASGRAEEPYDVGDFRPGTPLSRWALARYVVGRALAESLGTALLVVALVVLAVAGLIEWAGSTFWAVLVGVVAFVILAMRALLLSVLRRLTGARQYGPVDKRLRALVADTRRDVLRELRRVGLPGRTWTLPLLAVRLVRPSRRAGTLDRLRAFDVDRAVPSSRLDDLHLMLRSGLGRSGW